jgi:hypothetical protein
VQYNFFNNIRKYFKVADLNTPCGANVDAPSLLQQYAPQSLKMKLLIEYRLFRASR